MFIDGVFFKKSGKKGVDFSLEMLALILLLIVIITFVSYIVFSKITTNLSPIQ